MAEMRLYSSVMSEFSSVSKGEPSLGSSGYASSSAAMDDSFAVGKRTSLRYVASSCEVLGGAHYQQKDSKRVTASSHLMFVFPSENRVPSSSQSPEAHSQAEKLTSAKEAHQ